MHQRTTHTKQRNGKSHLSNMNTHQWSSSRFRELINLHQFSKDELIKEIVVEREEYLELERMLDEECRKREALVRGIKRVLKN